MTAIDTIRQNRKGVAAGAISAFFNSFTIWSNTRATRKALTKLSDRELNDIGLCRGDIDSFTA